MIAPGLPSFGAGGRIFIVAEADRKEVFAGEELQTSVLRGALEPGTQVRGPAVCAQAQATALVPPGWSGRVDETGNLLLTQESA